MTIHRADTFYYSHYCHGNVITAENIFLNEQPGVEFRAAERLRQLKILCHLTLSVFYPFFFFFQLITSKHAYNAMGLHASCTDF